MYNRENKAISFISKKTNRIDKTLTKLRGERKRVQKLPISGPKKKASMQKLQVRSNNNTNNSFPTNLKTLIKWTVLENCKSPKLTQEETESQNILLTFKINELVTKNLIKKKIPRHR